MIEISQINQSLSQNAVIVVFANVLLQQIGLPLPAVPTLMLAGSLAATPGSLGLVLAAAIVASVIADWVWYAAGKAFGYRVLAGLCKLSLNPASCVSQTEARFLRWGISSLVIAKFIPGFSTVAPPIAGALRMRLPGFLLAAAAGASLWAGLALAAGWLMRDAVQAAMSSLEQRLGQATPIVLGVIGIWLGWKLWQNYRFKKFSSIPHITVDELITAMNGESRPLLLDLRGATMIAETGPIPGAVVAEHDFLRDAVGDWPKHRPIVTLCACPEDAGAIQAARRLREDGYQSVRPLAGGYDAWMAAGKMSVPRILGIDPGLRVTGFGVIELQGKQLVYVASGCIKSNDKASLPDRIRTLFAGISEVIATYQPNQAAVEKVFVNVNPQSTLLLGQARGAAISALVHAALPVAEYTALQTKQAVVGHGKAAKEQVQEMVIRLLNLPGAPTADAADALACAICHAHGGQGLGAMATAGYRVRGGRLIG